MLHRSLNALLRSGISFFNIIGVGKHQFSGNYGKGIDRPRIFRVLIALIRSGFPVMA